jgi:membrane protein DedA with SNARE-associated domain
VDDLVPLISRHGYLLLAAICFAEAVGLPLPAALAMLTAGAVAAYGKLNLYSVLGISLVAMLIGDVILYFTGRASGWALLGFLCRVSANPETCILRSAEYFYRRGKITLLFAKFIPGINTMSPPLAGSMKMRLEQFLQYDSLGIIFYVSAYSLGGFIFSDFLRAITRGVRSAGSAAEVILGVGLAVYPRVPVEELARRLATEDSSNLIVADVRSHGYYDAQSERIAGSVRLEPNNLEEEIKKLPLDREIYLYCT